MRGALWHINENLEWENEILAATPDFATPGAQHQNRRPGNKTCARTKIWLGKEKSLHQRTRAAETETRSHNSDFATPNQKGEMNSKHKIQKPTPKTKITHLLYRN
jgi:hypothetical protein